MMDGSENSQEQAAALRTVQLVYGALAFAALVVAMVFHYAVDGLPEADTRAIASAFLVVAAADVGMMFAWEYLKR
jgi:hypothetical protein